VAAPLQAAQLVIIKSQYCYYTVLSQQPQYDVTNREMMIPADENLRRCVERNVHQKTREFRYTFRGCGSQKVMTQLVM